MGRLHHGDMWSPLSSLQPARAVPPSMLAAGPCCPTNIPRGNRVPRDLRLPVLRAQGPKGPGGQVGSSTWAVSSLHPSCPRGALACPVPSPFPEALLGLGHALGWLPQDRQRCQPACKVSLVTEQLSLVGSWRGGSKAALAWFPL